MLYLFKTLFVAKLHFIYLVSLPWDIHLASAEYKNKDDAAIAEQRQQEHDPHAWKMRRGISANRMDFLNAFWCLAFGRTAIHSER